MTVTEIVDELRATRPRASEPLRLHVLTTVAEPLRPEPSLIERLRRRRIMLAVPAVAGLAVASAVAIGITRPDPALRDAAAPPPGSAAQELGQRSSEAPPSATYGSAADAATAQKAAPGAVDGRAQRYSATLTLGVEDTDALSEATQRALSIARDLGGFVVSVRYATGDEGAASVTLRVPSARSADAVTRLSSLGKILSQNVQIDDLQESLDGLDQALRQLRAQLGAVNAQLERTLSAADRARLLERRAQIQAQLRELRTNRSATAAEARLATFQLELRTEQQSSVPATSSRLDRALDRALAVLAWEGVVVLAIGIAAAPLVLLGVGLWAARRMQRRRDEDRLLAAS
jgi:hypothetical protein